MHVGNIDSESDRYHKGKDHHAYQDHHGSTTLTGEVHPTFHFRVGAIDHVITLSP
jgi:hypothetical protein